MADTQSTTALMIPQRENVLEQGTCPGWSARELYDYLELDASQWARWAKKNIVTNTYAIEHIDWEGLRHNVENRIDTHQGGRPTHDYFLSLDFAKRLAMMARSAKGEEARQYFLECERLSKEPTLPILHDPAYQMLMQAVIDLDSTRHRVTQLEAGHQAHMQAVIEMQQRTIQALQLSQGASAKADLAFEATSYLAVEEFVIKNSLLHQFPPSGYKKMSAWLKDFCEDYGLEIRKAPVYGKPWDAENAYPWQAFSAYLRYDKRRPHQIALVNKSTS